MLDNPRADRVRALARLADRTARERAGAFLAEGPAATREALAGGWGGSVREVYLTSVAADRHGDLVRMARQNQVPLRECSEAVIAVLAGTRTPQGVVAVCDLVASDLGAALARAAAAPAPLVAVLARVSDPGNAGTILRTADAAGAGAVVLSAGSVDVHNPKCVRSTAGSLFHLDVVEGVPVHEALAVAREHGFVVLAADAGPGAVDLDDLLDDADLGRGPLTGPAAWLFGTEAHGLEAHERELADVVVRAPMHGRAESLNLAAAAAVCLYASSRGQRAGRREGRPGRDRRSATPVMLDARSSTPSGHTVGVNGSQASMTSAPE